eukprot:jgi/Chrpa1/10348/Chrysochromulina_OHIO_Genome00006696-RA
MQPAEPQPHDAHAALLRMLTHALRQRAERRKELERLQKAADEYEELQQMLRALPAKVEHQMLVPFGKLAFFPGTLKHTNEIMVLLGDNYFALRSAEQAAAIAGRRAEFVRPKVAAAEAEVATLDARIRQIRQYGELQMRDNPEGTIEIREPYCSDEEEDDGAPDEEDDEDDEDDEDEVDEEDEDEDKSWRSQKPPEPPTAPLPPRDSDDDTDDDNEGAPGRPAPSPRGKLSSTAAASAVKTVRFSDEAVATGRGRQGAWGPPPRAPTHGGATSAPDGAAARMPTPTPAAAAVAFTQQVTERDPTAPPSEADISMSEVHCEAVRLQQIRASRSGTVVYDPLERDASARGDGDDGSAADNKPVSRFKASRMRQQQQQ